MAFALTLLAYYRRFHFGVGSAVAVLFVALPLAVLVALVFGYGGRAVARRVTPNKLYPLGWAVGAMVLALTLLFLAEWVRTAKGRASDRLGASVHRLTIAEAGGRLNGRLLRSLLFSSPTA